MYSVQFVRHHPDVIMPKKGSPEAACFDLFSYSMSSEARGYTVRSGLSIELPPGYCLLILPRSGLSTKYGLTLQNTVGVVDSDYRGEIIMKFNRGDESAQGEISQLLQYGNRVAQALILPVLPFTWQEVEVLGTTERGVGGFGSTGVER